MFVTGVFANIDLADGSVRYINCGHPFPRVVRASGSVDVMSGGHCLPLGVTDDLGLGTPGADVLNPGDVLVIYTDGITESAAPDGARFGDAGVDASVGVGESARATLSGLLRSLEDFRQGAARTDDECVLVVRRC